MSSTHFLAFGLNKMHFTSIALIKQAKKTTQQSVFQTITESKLKAFQVFASGMKNYKFSIGMTTSK